MIRNVSDTSQISKTLPNNDVIKTITINFEWYFRQIRPKHYFMSIVILKK